MWETLKRGASGCVCALWVCLCVMLRVCVCVWSERQEQHLLSAPSQAGFTLGCSSTITARVLIWLWNRASLLHARLKLSPSFNLHWIHWVEQYLLIFDFFCCTIFYRFALELQAALAHNYVFVIILTEFANEHITWCTEVMFIILCIWVFLGFFLGCLFPK